MVTLLTRKEYPLAATYDPSEKFISHDSSRLIIAIHLQSKAYSRCAW